MTRIQLKFRSVETGVETTTSKLDPAWMLAVDRVLSEAPIAVTKTREPALIALVLIVTWRDPAGSVAVPIEGLIFVGDPSLLFKIKRWVLISGAVIVPAVFTNPVSEIVTLPLTKSTSLARGEFWINKVPIALRVLP